MDKWILVPIELLKVYDRIHFGGDECVVAEVLCSYDDIVTVSVNYNEGCYSALVREKGTMVKRRRTILDVTPEELARHVYEKIGEGSFDTYSSEVKKMAVYDAADYLDSMKKLNEHLNSEESDDK